MLKKDERCSTTCRSFFSVSGITKIEYDYGIKIMRSINTIKEMKKIKIKQPKMPRISKKQKRENEITEKYDKNPIPKGKGDEYFRDINWLFDKEDGL